MAIVNEIISMIINRSKLSVSNSFIDNASCLIDRKSFAYDLSDLKNRTGITIFCCIH